MFNISLPTPLIEPATQIHHDPQPMPLLIHKLSIIVTAFVPFEPQFIRSPQQLHIKFALRFVLLEVPEKFLRVYRLSLVMTLHQLPELQIEYLTEC